MCRENLRRREKQIKYDYYKLFQFLVDSMHIHWEFNIIADGIAIDWSLQSLPCAHQKSMDISTQIGVFLSLAEEI